jgi:adenosylhomocysteinase
MGVSMRTAAPFKPTTGTVPLKSELPAVSALVSRYSPQNKLSLILITHVLPTAVPFVTTLADIFDVEVIGIPYSTCVSAANAIRHAKIRLTVPATIEDIPAAALHAVALARELGRRVIIQEIGGYLASCSERLAEFDNFLGIVEDTNNGHWRYQAIQDTLRYPVVSIAHSPIKRIEDQQIGPAVSYSVERMLRESFFTVLKGKRILVLGFGSIGSSCANALRARSASPVIFDTDSIRMMHAQTEGFRTGDFHSLAPEIDLIIGATGRCSIDADMIRLVRRGAILISASSKQIEFDINGFRRDYSVCHVDADLDHYHQDDHDFFILGDGFPLNFRDFSVLGDVLDAIYAELFICMREIAERRVGSGLTYSWPEVHKEVAKTWCEAHSGRIAELVPNG